MAITHICPHCAEIVPDYRINIHQIHCPPIHKKEESKKMSKLQQIQTIFTIFTVTAILSFFYFAVAGGSFEPFKWSESLRIGYLWSGIIKIFILTILWMIISLSDSKELNEAKTKLNQL